MTMYEKRKEVEKLLKAFKETGKESFKIRAMKLLVECITEKEEEDSGSNG